MNTNTANPQDTTAQSQDASTASEPSFRAGPHRVMLRRSFQDRMLTGVAGGIGRYFGVDAMIVRIAFVVLTVFGGVGIPLYLAGLLLIPEEGSDISIAGSLIESLQRRSY
jgi:phage shock protein PspC (stress-responsive transcriptional regulator)